MPGTIYDSEMMIKEMYEALRFDEIYTGMPIQTNRGPTVPVYSKSGKIVGYDLVTTGQSPTVPGSGYNSNIGGGSYGPGSQAYSVNMGTKTTEGTTRSWSGAYRSSGASAGAKVATVASKVSTAICAVSAAMWLGKAIDQTLYNAAPDFWDEHLPTINPQTWTDMATTEGGKDFIRSLFNLDNGKGEMYIPDDMLALTYMTLLQEGAFSPGQEHEYDIPTSQQQDTIVNFPNPITSTIATRETAKNSFGDGYVLVTDTPVIMLSIKRSTGTPTTGDGTLIALSKTPFRYGRVWTTSKDIDTWTPDTYRSATAIQTLNGTTFYYAERTYSNSEGVSISSPLNYMKSGTYPDGAGPLSRVGTIVFDGTTISPATGVTTDPNADTQIDPNQITGNTPQEVKDSLQQHYPQLWDDAIEEDIPQQDGTTKKIKYVPVPYPNTTDKNKPTTGDNHQNDPQVAPETNTQTQIEDFLDYIRKDLTPSPPDPGSGSSPTVVMPTGQGSSLWTVYNPTQGQLDAFGSWLWSSNFVEQIKKLFNDPMQAIIGVHKVYATPSTGGQVNIKCGYIDSGCPAAEVTSQYTTVDCGSVSLREYFGNVLDYPPYTEVGLYLPFIGIVKLDPADVLRSTVHVIYHVDVITGACLADVKVSRDGENAILYQYSGSAICSYPLSSGSYAGVVTGVLSMAAGIAGTVLSGGAAAPALIGGAMGITHLHTDVQKSGSFSGSAGAMGGKVPYVIISRAQDATPANFEQHEGKPASKTVTLGNCDGFVRVKSINIDDVPATYGELDQIVSLLKTGVIL